MLSPRALLDALLFLGALRMPVAPLLSVLLPVALVLPLLLLSVLLPVVLVLPLLLLRVLLSVVLVLPLVWLSVLLWLVRVVPRLLLRMLLRLSMLLFRLGLLMLALLLCRMVLLLVLLLVLCVSRSSDSEKQRQNGCTSDPNWVHMSPLFFPNACVGFLAQASSCRVYRAADGFARHQKFHSPVLLPTSGVLVGGHGQGVTEASG